jgi:hypothetical protein
MRGYLGKVGVAAALAVLAGCTTPQYVGDRESVTIPYDPYNYDPDELMDQAEAHCSAYGRHAVYVDETIDPNSVRWRYRHFDCV